MAFYKKSDISPIQAKPPPKKGSGDSEAGDEKEDQAADEIEDIDAEIEEKLSNKDDKTPDEMKQSQSKPSIDKEKARTTPKLTQHDSKAIRPQFSWKELVRQFVASAGPPEITYTKPNSRVATQVSIAQQTGAAAIKPGEKPGEGVFKLLIVFDTSGSMHSAIKPALAETSALLNLQKGSVSPIVGITFFADSPLYLAADLLSSTAWQIPTFKDLNKKADVTTKQTLASALSSSMSGGTNFSGSLASELSQMASQGFNVIIFSDTDILYGDNWTNFLNLYKSNQRKIFFIADNSYSFNQVVTKLGINPKTFGHM